jgi:predicted acyltransferase
MSLDVFRGITIAAMILVNDPGDGPSAYWPLQHAKWNGWTPTDLIFPFFLFIVGVAMAFSFHGRIGRGHSRSDLFTHALRRGLVLFAFGILLNGFPNHYHLATWRVYGDLLHHHVRDVALDRPEDTDSYDHCVPRGILDRHAFRSRAGPRHSDARYAAARS